MFTSSSKNQKRKIVVTLLALGLITFLIYFLQNTAPIKFAKGVIQTFFETPRSIIYNLGKNEREDEVEKLKKEIENLQKRLVDYDSIRRDNEALRSQFDLSGETTRSLTNAKIIGFLGENKNPHELIINVGRNQGILNGMTVISGEYLVGKVVSASENYSSVMTPFNPKFQVLARLSETDANGLVVGRSDLLLFEGVVITDELKEGGLVVTKGEVDRNGIGVVPDIIVGKISSISKNETAPFQNAQLEPLVNYSRLSNVFIITRM